MGHSHLYRPSQNDRPFSQSMELANFRTNILYLVAIREEAQRGRVKPLDDLTSKKEGSTETHLRDREAIAGG